MEISRSSKVFMIRPEILSVVLGILWALIVALATLVAMGTGVNSKLIELFDTIYPWYHTSVAGLFWGIIWGFISGYLFGFLVGYFYLWLIKRGVTSQNKVFFEIDPTIPVNVIQKVSGDKHYNIAIVANPKIMKVIGDPDSDPIIADSNLFYKVVLRILRSFSRNELLRLPEIWNRIQITTVFDPDPIAVNEDNALCQEIQAETNILSPRQTKGVVKNYLEKRGVQESDVVFVVSASGQLTRSAALFTEDSKAGDGVPFSFTFQDGSEDRVHIYEPNFPGVAAISAWDDRLKTPVHEFAHAMSSIENGAIVDEYLDEYDVGVETELTGNMINRKKRGNAGDPIPDVFARYQINGNGGVTYFSDRWRSDKPVDWKSYTPERVTPGISCIMDIAYYGYRFDKLVFDFMYDRLLAKINKK